MTSDEGPWTAVDLLQAFQRMVRKQDHWRGYVGDSLSDVEAEALLQEAIDALTAADPALDERSSAPRGWAIDHLPTEGLLPDSPRAWTPFRSTPLPLEVWFRRQVQALAEGPLDGLPRSLASWRKFGYPVEPVGWLRPGQALIADGVLHVSDASVCPEGWTLQPCWEGTVVWLDEPPTQPADIKQATADICGVFIMPTRGRPYTHTYRPSTPLVQHFAPHFGDRGTCQCNCDVCTTRLGTFCVCEDCPCGGPEDHQEAG